MQRIDNLSDSAMQLTKVALDDGTVVEIALRFGGATQRWLVSVTRESFSVKGLNVCVHPNLMRPWRNVIPFGIACVTSDGADPTYFNDFLADPQTLLSRANLFVLSAAEVHEVERTILGNFS